MRAFYFRSCLLLLLVSCSDKNKIPPSVLPPDKMQAVLTDLLIADAVNNERTMKDTALKLPIENASYFQRIFQLHRTTKNEFNSSYHFYLKRPDLFKVITDSISSVLNRRNENLTKGVDSIKNKPNGNNLKKITGLPWSQQ